MQRELITVTPLRKIQLLDVHSLQTQCNAKTSLLFGVDASIRDLMTHNVGQDVLLASYVQGTALS